MRSSREEERMFSVLFEVHPRADQWQAYLDSAKMLRPELERVDGFVENIRYRSLTREGWILSLSGWRDEKAVVRWRTKVRHHEIQEKGREEILSGYHLRVGQVTRDTQVPAGYTLQEQRLDETEVGDGTTAMLIDAHQSSEWVKATDGVGVSRWLGLNADAPGLLAWDAFDAVLKPGDVILLLSWHRQADADRFAESVSLPEGARLRQIRVVRDYGMYDRREAPQYYPDAAGEQTLHA
jgi:heme-degrading monooxygenase HmoA